MLTILGPAGSGKSYTMQVVMQQAMEFGARVILACPTRVLVASYREEMPGLDVDSIHAAFGLRYLLSNMGKLEQCTKLFEFTIHDHPLEMAEKLFSSMQYRRNKTFCDAYG